MAIDGKVALITGAAQGIGRGIALRLAKDGANICVVDLSKDKAEEVAEEVRALGRKATTFVADVTSREQMVEAVDHAEKELGGFDIIVNNAGISLVCPLIDISQEELDKVFKINVYGVVWGIQAAAKKFIARNQKGKIINGASIASYRGSEFLGSYGATKFAVRSLTQIAARELARKGITVNAYCPGIVDTPMWDVIDGAFVKLTGAVPGETYKKYRENIALGRTETPEDVAGLVSYLAGPDSDYMTGQSVIIDGGIVFS